MTHNRAQNAGLTAGLAALAALAAGGMAVAPPNHPIRMSGLHIEGLAGSPVVGPNGRKVGQIVNVEADGEGRTRWLDIALEEGGQARVASFRAFLDAPNQRITVTLPEDLLASRADAAGPPATSPSI